MGRDAVATCHWRGEIAEVKLHLDGKSLNLRGNIRADLPRANITEIHQISEGVTLVVAGEPLLIEFNTIDAKRWVAALRKAPPTLALKLGVSTKQLAFVRGNVADADLLTALAGATSDDIALAGQILAIITTDRDLTETAALAERHPEKHLWMVYPKGAGVLVGDTAIRTYMRGNGFIDSKSCAVSDRLTATRYRKRLA